MGILASLDHSPDLVPDNPALACAENHPVQSPAFKKAYASPRLADPWRIILQLGELLVKDCSATELREAALRLLMHLPGLLGAWIGRPNEQGLLVADAATDAGLLALINGGDYPISIRDDSPWGKGPAGRAWRAGAPEILDDWQTSPLSAPWLKASRARGWRAMAAVPLRGRNGSHGILILYADQPGFFATNLPLTVITQVGAVLGLAVEERESDAALRRMQRIYRTLFAGSHALLAARNEHRVLTSICRRLVESGLFNAATIGRRDQENILRYDCIRHEASTRPLFAVSQPVDATGPELLLGVRAWQKRAIVFSNDCVRDPALAPWHDLFKSANWQAMAAVPIRRAGRQWAILMVAADQRGIFDDELVQLVEQLAAMVGKALDEVDLKAKLLAERQSQSRLARHDTLTKLPNRLALTEYLPQALARTRRRDQVMAVAVLDFDDFKLVNDRFGHAVGDEVLRTLAQRLKKALRKSDFVARLGGDEFALILEDLPRDKSIEEFCARLTLALSAPLRLADGRLIDLAVSLGATLVPAGCQATDTLFRHADTALYHAKLRKSTRQRFWTLYQDLTSNQASAEPVDQPRSRCEPFMPRP
jgi:diguanylate cyclase (GGDEF)-like protein